jgi:DNA invertase Pin-like site-specific DNA recombinase
MFPLSRDFLMFAVACAIIVLSAAAHSPRLRDAWVNCPRVRCLSPFALLRPRQHRQAGQERVGPDAQKAAVADRLNGGRWQIVGEFIEIESGKRVSRPQLDGAIAACKKQKAKLIVAKLDRLSRNVAFLLKLIDSGVEVLFADLPELNGAMGRFMLTTMASVAELEAGLISERTKAALKAAKARGVKLGRHGAEVLAPRYRQEA